MSDNLLSSAVKVGFFGKLPSRGDFVRVGLSRPTTDTWDQWLSSVMPRAEPELLRLRQGIGWRFAFAPNVCGPFALTGIWLPSSDRVGRIFPLLIAAEQAAATDAFLDSAEAIGMQAIRDMMTPEALVRQLDAAPQPEPATGTDQMNARWWRKGNEIMVTEETLPDFHGFARMFSL